MQNEDLKLTIKAKDEATATIKKVETELTNVSTSMKKAGESSASMTASIFKGAAAYDLFRTSLRAAVGFLKDSMSESLNASRIMTQVETNVKNAGFAYDELAPKLQAYGENAVQLGFDDEEAAQSLSKLLLVTKDYGQAQALANLSMDLARAKNIDLETATKQVTLATQGNVKELKLLGIDLDENATTAQNLTKMQDQLKNSAVNFSNTAGGSIETLKQEYSNLKQKVGDELMPSMIELFSVLEDNKETIVSFANGFIFLGKAIGYVAKGYVGFGNIVATGTSGIIEGAAKGWAKIVEGLNNVGIGSDEAVKKTKGWAEEWSATTKAAADATLDLYNKVPELNKSMNDTSKELANLKDKSGTTSAGLAELKDKIKDANKSYVELSSSIKESLTGIEDDHKQAMDSLADDIGRVKKELKDLASSYKSELSSALKSYTESSKSNTQSLVESIIANEDAIAKLKAQLTGGGLNAKEKQAIESELAGRLAAEESNAGIIASLSGEIAKQKEYNAMSELDRAIYDYQQRKIMADTEYSETVARINATYKEKKLSLTKELNDLKEKQNAEEKLYDEKTAFIKAKMAESLTVNKTFADANLNVTKSQVTAEIEYYEQLAKAIKAARSANTGAFANIKNSVNSITTGTPSHEHGGIVIGPRGMPVPIIAHGGETITPAGKSSNNGNSIVVNINNPQVRNNSDLDLIKEQVENVFRDVIRINKLQF